MGSSVENFSDRSEGLLLTRRVPNLQLQHCVFDLDQVRSKLHTHRLVVILTEVVISEPLQDTRFPNTYEQFKQIDTNDQDITATKAQNFAAFLSFSILMPCWLHLPVSPIIMILNRLWC